MIDTTCNNCGYGPWHSDDFVREDVIQIAGKIKYACPVCKSEDLTFEGFDLFNPDGIQWPVSDKK